MRIRLFAFSVLLVAVALAGCHHGARPGSASAGVTDMASFQTFIATHPTLEAFKKAYPDVQLMLPGTISTREIRYDNSRFFPNLDKDGRIVGGDFH